MGVRKSCVYTSIKNNRFLPKRSVKNCKLNKTVYTNSPLASARRKNAGRRRHQSIHTTAYIQRSVVLMIRVPMGRNGRVVAVAISRTLRIERMSRTATISTGRVVDVLVGVAVVVLWSRPGITRINIIQFGTGLLGTVRIGVEG